ncbi:ATP-dependent DNA ligase [Prauserella sp. PE36]|uniref:ATP-dependent DNA ligase n=1 Tax=Prauserella sp. PE36 TaxID=1504709 RepID=UPI001314B5BF|nr:ATP-dependent DNA ligase [Prauserella sp. PE36]
MPVPPPPLPLAAAVPAATLPVRDDLLYETKVDGWRVCVHGPAGVLHSRRPSDLTARFPDILAAVQRLKGGAVLDGELVAYRPGGGLEFVPLTYSSRRRAAEGVALVFVAFDLLAWRGRDQRGQPLHVRRARLADLLGQPGGPVQLVGSTDDPATAAQWISAEQAAVGIEGVVAKPTASTYPTRAKERSGWIKVKYSQTAEAVVLGVLGPISAPTALVLGQADDNGTLHPIGLSAPLSRRALASLAGRLRPIAGTPRIGGGLFGGEPRIYTPVQPDVEVEIHTDATRDLGRFRHRITVTNAKAP